MRSLALLLADVVPVCALTEAETEYGGETSCWRCATERGTTCWQALCLAPVDG